MNTGEKLKDARERRHISADRLGEMVGVAKTTILRYESGEIEKIPYFVFLKILIALEATPEEILPEEELELVRKSDELRGFYNTLGKKQRDIATKLKNLPPEDVSYVDGIVQGLLKRHPE